MEYPNAIHQHGDTLHHAFPTQKDKDDSPDAALGIGNDAFWVIVCLLCIFNVLEGATQYEQRPDHCSRGERS